jgi:hypothetical protein
MVPAGLKLVHLGVRWSACCNGSYNGLFRAPQVKNHCSKELTLRRHPVSETLCSTEHRTIQICPVPQTSEPERDGSSELFKIKKTSYNLLFVRVIHERWLSTSAPTHRSITRKAGKESGWNCSPGGHVTTAGPGGDAVVLLHDVLQGRHARRPMKWRINRWQRRRCG